MRHLIEFSNTGEEIAVEALEDSILILGHALPFNEPVVARGPFVMNTQQQIYEAYQDYQAGKFAWIIQPIIGSDFLCLIQTLL